MSGVSNQNFRADQPGLTPWKLIQTYSADEWEEFVVEWTDGLRSGYRQVVHLAGAGDKGRDVIVYLDDPKDPTCPWDNYQCKHYAHPLRPSDVYTELGKLCVYTFRGDYTIPRIYRFVSPIGVGTKLHDLLKRPEEVKRELIANCAGYCEKRISEKEDFPLVGELKKYVEGFDFSIVWFLTPQEVLSQHQQTRHWHRRFKIDLPKRPIADPPPAQIQPHELPYVKCLLDAYGDYLKKDVLSLDELANLPKLAQHFYRARGYFFTAEALARFSRDQFAPGAFDSVKDQVHSGVVEVTAGDHRDGYACLYEVAKAATALLLPDSDLVPYVGPADKIGMCHHLANDGRLCWVGLWLR